MDTSARAGWYADPAQGLGLRFWDGSAWTPSASGAGQALRGVWGSKAGGVWAVGDFGTILHHP